ncbi:polysaccharide deacetylase family protein [Alteromonadaceae bacterium BrNp21-10]|nr:polysaccharide deacetylase family protein [Alteromonadaceae bacterium BrNp21-10]
MWIKFTALLTLLCLSYNALSKDNAVILLYHHVANDTPASTTISPKQFGEHLRYLDKHHVVMPLATIINKLQQGIAIDDKAVAITFDDGYQDIFENAHPLLKEYKFPYTVFINPDVIGVQSDQLSWQTVKLMSKQGATFANHTNGHGYLLNKPDAVDEQQWLMQIKHNVQDAEQTLLEHLGYSLKFIAYPYGEYNQAITSMLKAEGYVGFGQQSGALASYSDFTALPRFPAAGIYANIEPLKVKLASLAMPVLDNSYQLQSFEQGQDYPELILRIGLEDILPRQFTCYFNSEILSTSWQDDRVSVSIPHQVTSRRSRVNCTAPSIRDPKRYYWFSQTFFAPSISE